MAKAERRNHNYLHWEKKLQTSPLFKEQKQKEYFFTVQRTETKETKLDSVIVMWPQGAQ